MLLIALFAPLALFAQSIPIAQARSLPVGSSVTVRGIVTNGGELGIIRYLQDGTGGIAAFPGSGSAPGFNATVKLGDSIEVSGTLILFRGLLEISPITAWQVIAPGMPLPVPKAIQLANISGDLESQLVSIPCVTFSDAGGVFANAATYDIVDTEGGSAKIYLRSGHPLQFSSVPTEPVQLTGILSIFDDFQLLPRTASDLTPASCFYFLNKPEQSDIQTTGFKLNWKTNWLSSTKLRYGTSPALGSEITLPMQSLNHAHNLSGLQPGAVYWVQIEATHNGSTIRSPIRPYATRSLSSGQIKVYFNFPIDESSAGGLVPDGQSFDEVLAETLARINAAEQTLDVAMYNNNRTDITNALKAAHARGVQVRYVAALDASNPALQPQPPFPVLYGNNSALMHNKFMIVDANLTDKCWVMSGSLNWTTLNMTKDYNNTLFIQDQSLAQAYKIEFEEMWGGSGTQPNPAAARFAGTKKDNTPHQFIIGNIAVESYFSPSDQTTSRIVSTIGTADSEALFALFSFTKDEPAVALADAYWNGVQVRGMIENINDQGAEYAYLLSQGVPVRHHSASGDLHHKYAVLDADAPQYGPAVLTGSHNWSNAAETSNDENTLIIHDANLARLYKAEFERRWAEVSVSTTMPTLRPPTAFPNPVSEMLTLQYEAPANGIISVRNILGEILFQTTSDASGTSCLNVGGLPAGFYLASVETRHGIATISFQKI